MKQTKLSSKDPASRLYKAMLVIESIAFLEKEAAAVLDKVAKLEADLERAEDFSVKELIYAELETCEPQLRALIRRCKREGQILDDVYRSDL